MRMWFVLGSYLYKMYVNLQTPLWLTNLTKAAKGIQTFSPRPKTVLQKFFAPRADQRAKLLKLGLHGRGSNLLKPADFLCLPPY